VTATLLPLTLSVPVLVIVPVCPALRDCAVVLDVLMLKLFAIAGVKAERVAQRESAQMETSFFMHFLIRSPPCIPRELYR
jgi:hypothetical protein